MKPSELGDSGVFFLCLSNLCRWTICVMISVIREGFCLAWPFPDLVVSNNPEPTLCLLLQRKFVFSCCPFHIRLSYVAIHTFQFSSRQLLSYCPLHHRKVLDRSSLLSQEKVGVLADFGFTECHALSSEVDLHVTDTDLQEPREQHGRWEDHCSGLWIGHLKFFLPLLQPIRISFFLFLRNVWFNI